MPLIPFMALTPFKKWRVDFVDPIAPITKYGQERHILVATNYATKWAKAMASCNDDAKMVAYFLYKISYLHLGVHKN